MVKKRQAVRGVRQVRENRLGSVMKNTSRLLSVFWRPRLLAVFILLTGVVVVYEEINIKDVLPIASVKIEGEFNYLDKNLLQNKALPVVEGGFFSVDLEAVRNELINLPWVEDVSVRRLWPDQLLVRVIEKQPVVYWGDESLLSSKGELFVPEKILDINMPHLEGPEGQHKTMLKELARMQAWLLETGLQIQKMKLDARRSWSLQMSSGLKLRLGRKQMHERLQRFALVYKNNLQSENREIMHIDMRYTNGFAVAWKEA